MDVDGQSEQSNDPSHLLQELSELIVKLDAQPLDVSLLRRQVQILASLPMTEEFNDATDTLSSLVSLEPAAWIGYLDRLITSPCTLDMFLSAAEKFAQAEEDYLSSELLHRHATFIIECSELDQEMGDEDLRGLLTPDYARDLLREVADKASGLIGDSSRIWNAWADWETRQLAVAADQSAQLEHLHSMYLDRLRCPHLDIEATSANYSSLCTAHCPHEYETRLVKATAAAQGAKAKLNSERRHGATRQDYEDQLAGVFAGPPSTEADFQALMPYPASRLPLLQSYIAWETDPKAKPPGAKSGPTMDPMLIRAVFERTLTAYAEASSNTSDDSERLAYKDGEASIWVRYVNWLRNSKRLDDALVAANRAVRACPEVATVWISLLYLMELHNSSQDDLLSTYNRVFSLGSITRRPTPTFVDVVVARAAMQARAESLKSEEDQLDPVLETVKQGVELLQNTHRGGDPTLKLEKFVLEWAETKSPANLEQALALVEKPIRARASSYQMTLLRAGVEARRGETEAARELYLTAIQRSDLDWPEAVYEAFTQFESIHGTVETILLAARKIEKESEKLARRREKTAQTVALQASVEVEDQHTAATATAHGSQQEAKNVKQAPADGNDTRVRRDREHTTVLVSGLAKTSSKDLVESFFESCGKIRETTILSESAWPSSVALLEFQSVDSVSAALAKDRRKIGDKEISVTMLWRSTLFITNFPPETDDKHIRELFGKYGTILSTRWPSLKYAGNRRFCYLTMDSPASAENARLLLDAFKPNGDDKFGMKVLISDPSAKVKRSDARDSVIFVGGLNAKSTEDEVKELFVGHGQIQSIKMGWDHVKGICKGFAFVTMASEDDAKKAVMLHGTSHKGRLLKVELNDPNIANKKVASDGDIKEKRARTVRLNDLPEGTQEALLQQALHKIAPVRRLELFTKTRHALAELETASDVGKLLLRTEPFLFMGSPVIITEQGRRPDLDKTSASKGASNPSAATPTSALSFAPRIAKRPGRTLGKGRHAASSTTPAIPADSSGSNAPQDAFRALVESKNKQREGNLEASRAKRQHEAGIDATADGHDVKKPKTN